MASLNAVHTQGAIGVQWQSADGQVTLTTEQLIFQFMYAQCLGKDDIIQMDKEKVADITNDLKRAAELLAKLEDCKREAEDAKKAGQGSLVTGVLTDSEIKELNALIDKLGLSNLFAGTGLLPGAPAVRDMQTQALEAICYDPNAVKTMYAEARDIGYSGGYSIESKPVTDARGNTVMTEVVTWIPAFLSQEQQVALAARVLPPDLEADITLGKPIALGLFSRSGYAAKTSAEDRAKAVEAYQQQIQKISAPYVMEGGITPKTTIREVQSGITILNSEISSMNTKQQGFLTDTSNDIAKKGSFLDGMKSFVDQMGRTRSSTIQQAQV